MTGVRTGRRHGRVPGPGVEYEFTKLLLPRELSRNGVRRLLVEHAEHGGWEIDRLRIAANGTRRVVLRRKIIRQTRPWFVAEA